jgi:PDZ domain-containing secreted protein
MKDREEHRESALKTVDVNRTQLHYMERGENNNKQSAIVSLTALSAITVLGSFKLNLFHDTIE